MSKQINVNLVFNANTQQAKQQMNSLQASVNQLQTSLNQKISMNGLTEELSKAQNTAIQLKTNLNSAFNVDTGRLDLTKFNNNLKTSGMTLQQYKNNLSLLGVEGTKAFNELTQAIMQGEMPLHRANNLVTNLMNTFGNSVKWSLAYGSIHKITQGFREAFKYAEDLNNSLTNIRVITNQSADEMAKFAEKANKAAKSLATSTTAYTDAALIYYRQGLDEKEVEKRTATTLKLSNVVGQGAQEVSEWMTSIWNNFDDGSKSLEYYADVISKLGITTASSAEEIATGLEKFAAVADTVGLSYEYATSALATVTAQTRQSADTVGTAFKTLFARMQDLDLGKTLDDGTTLGQYSEALYKVGINIKDSAGNLRDMDNILDDMGAKWKTLDKDQQVALAKSVAGLRQYSQLIALMDNYDVFKTNVETAKMAEGALQEQQEVWAESWEAASKRVKAAAEGLYDSLIDDKFFIGLNNVFADLLNGANKFIDAIGGLKTLLPLIAGLMLKAFGPAALGALQSSFHSIMGPGKEQQAETLGMRKDALRLSQEMAAKESDTPNANTATKETLTSQKDILESVEGITRHLSEEELQRLRYLKEINRQYQEALQLAGKQVDTTQKEQQELERQSDNLRNQIQKSTKGTAGAVDNDYFKYAEAELSKATPEVEALRKKYLSGETLSSSEKDQIRDAMGWQKGGVGKGAGWNKQALEKQDISTTVKQRLQSEFEKDYKGVPDDIKKQHKEYLDIKEQDIKTTKKLEKEEENFSERQEQLKENTEKTTDEFKAMQKVPLGQTMIGLAAGVGQAAAGFNMFSSAIGNVKEMFDSGKHTLQGWLGALTSLGFAIPMITSGLSTMTQMLQGSAAAAVAATKANLNLDGSKRIQMLTEAGFNQTQATQIALTQTSITQKERELLLDETKTALEKQELLVKKGFTKEQAKEIVQNGTLDILNKKEIGSIWTRIKLKAAELALDWQRLAVMALIAVAIGTTIAVVKTLSDAYNADAKASKEAAENAKRIAEEYKEVKQKYDDLKNSIKDYADTQTALNKLTEGTQEWKNALIEANQQVLSLLTTYPELAQYVESVNGRLTIKDEGWNILSANMANQVADKSVQSQAANLRAEQKKLKSDITDFWREFGGIGKYKNQASEEEIKELITEYQNKDEIELKNLIGDLEDLGVKSDDVAGNIQKLITKTKELNKQEELLTQTRINAILTANPNINLSDYSKGAEKAVTKKADQILKENNLDIIAEGFDYNGWLMAAEIGSYLLGGDMARTAIEASRSGNKYAKDKGITGVRATERGEEIFKKYMEAQGIDAYGVDFHGRDIGYKVEGKDEDQKLTYQELAIFEQQQALEDSIEVFEKIINSSRVLASENKQGSDAAKIVSSLAENGDLSLLNPELLEKAQNMSKEEIQDIYNKYEDEINTLYFGDEKIKNAEDFAKYIREIAEALDENQLKANIAAYELERYNSILTAGSEKLEVSKEALQAYSETLQSANENIDKIQSAESAVEHFTLAKAVNELRTAFEKNINTLQNANANTLEYAQSLGDVKKAIDAVFKTNVSTDFIKSNLSEIEKMLNGSVEAYEKLQKLAVSDWIENIATDASSINQIKGLFDKLADETKKQTEGKFFEIELDANIQPAIKKLNELVRQGIISEQELETAFSNAGLEWAKDSTFTTYTLPQLTKTESETYGPDGKLLSTTTSINSSETTLPWIGDNPPEFKSITGKSSKKNFKESETYIDSTGKEVSGETIRKNYSQYLGETFQVKGSGEEKDNTLNVQKKKNVGVTKDVLTFDGETDLTSTQKAKKLSDLDKELDRYHEINELLSDQERQLNKLSKAKDKVYGANRLSVMNQEIAKQKEIIENNRVLLASTEAYLQQDRQNLLSQFAVELDTSGRITNYEELQQGYINRLKANIQNEDTYKRIEEEYNLFKDVAGQYEETLNKVEEQVEKVNDEMDKLYEFNLEKIQYTVQIKVDISDDDKAYIDFLMQKIDNDAFAAADAIQLMGRETADTIQKIEAYNQGISDTEATFARGEITQEQYVETLREYRDQLIDANATLLELRENVQTKLTEAFDAWNEKIEKSRDKLEHLSSVLEHYKNIIDIVGKKQLGISNQLMKELRDTQLNNARDSLKAAKAQKDAIDETLAGYKAAREAAQDEESRKEWDKQIELAEEKAAEAAETVNELFETTLELAKSNFEDTVNDIADIFSESISGIYDSLEDLRKGWDRQQEVSERYLTTYKQTYEINKLNRKIQQDIEKSNNLGNQKQLHGLQEEMLKMTKDNQKLSKYDLEYLQKKYDLMVAEQALREAQNAKSIVRLQRDSEGNFGYVYTADQNNIDKTKQEYEDKLYAYQEFSDKVDKQLTETTIKLNEWAYEQIQNAAQLYGEGTQKYEEEVSRILYQYNEDMLYITDEYDKLTGRNLRINKQFNAGVAETYNDTYLNKIYPDYNEFSENYDATTSIIKTTIGQLKTAETEYETNTEQIFNDAGLDIGNYKNTVSTNLGEIRKESGDTSKKIGSMSEEMKISMNLSTGYVQDFQKTYSSQMEIIRNNTDTTITKVNGLIASYKDLATQAGIATEAERTYQAVKSQASVVSSSVSSVDYSKLAEKSDKVKITNINYKGSQTRYKIEGSDKWYTANDLNLTAQQQRNETVGMEISKSKINYNAGLKQTMVAVPGDTASKAGSSFKLQYNNGNKNDGVLADGRLIKTINGKTYVTTIADHNRWYELTQLTKTDYMIFKGAQRYEYIGYDTGGYTGSWGPEGRLAMLHQKELVLNKDDTENFLAAIGIVRDISDQIEKNALIIRSQNIFTDYQTALPQNKETLQQEVTIHAEFPNATNHSEIEEAFRNLTNYASQYANRKN